MFCISEGELDDAAAAGAAACTGAGGAYSNARPSPCGDHAGAVAAAWPRFCLLSGDPAASSFGAVRVGLLGMGCSVDLAPSKSGIASSEMSKCSGVLGSMTVSKSPNSSKGASGTNNGGTNDDCSNGKVSESSETAGEIGTSGPSDP